MPTKDEATGLLDAQRKSEDLTVADTILTTGLSGLSEAKSRERGSSVAGEGAAPFVAAASIRGPVALNVKEPRSPKKKFHPSQTSTIEIS